MGSGDRAGRTSPGPGSMPLSAIRRTVSAQDDDSLLPTRFRTMARRVRLRRRRRITCRWIGTQTPETSHWRETRIVGELAPGESSEGTAGQSAARAPSDVTSCWPVPTATALRRSRSRTTTAGPRRGACWCAGDIDEARRGSPLQTVSTSPIVLDQPVVGVARGVPWRVSSVPRPRRQARLPCR